MIKMKKYLLSAIIVLLLFTQVAKSENSINPKRFKDFEALRILRLTQELDLSDEEMRKVMPVLQKYSEERRMLLFEYRKALMELAESLHKDSKGEILMNKISQVEACMKKLDKNRWNEWEEIKILLPIQKQARYLLFQDMFFREILRFHKK
jgi:DNA-binding transcriptional MerR regulator